MNKIGMDWAAVGLDGNGNVSVLGYGQTAEIVSTSKIMDKICAVPSKPKDTKLSG